METQSAIALIRGLSTLAALFQQLAQDSAVRDALKKAQAGGAIGAEEMDAALANMRKAADDLDAKLSRK